MNERRASVFLLFAVLAATVACPARRAGQAEDSAGTGSEPDEADASASDAAPDAGTGYDVHGDAESLAHDSGPVALDADQPHDAAPAAPPELPPGRLVARAEIPDGGAQLRIEEIDDGYALRLVAGESAGIAVEPIGRLNGPSTSGVYLGPGCRRAGAGEAEVLGVWTLELEHCATTLEPTAAMKGRSARVGCRTRAAPGGRYSLSLYRCGRYSEPLFDVGFDVGVPAPADSGPAD